MPKVLTRADCLKLAVRANEAVQIFEEIRSEFHAATTAGPDDGNIVHAPTWLVFAHGYAASCADSAAGLEDVITRHMPGALESGDPDTVS